MTDDLPTCNLAVARANITTRREMSARAVAVQEAMLRGEQDARAPRKSAQPEWGPSRA